VRSRNENLFSLSFEVLNAFFEVDEDHPSHADVDEALHHKHRLERGRERQRQRQRGRGRGGEEIRVHDTCTVV
jgi:hypothetical protein